MANLVSVRLRTRMAGPEGNWGSGEVIQTSEEHASALVAGGFAEYVKLPAAQAEPVAPVELATVAAPERAVAPRGRKRTREVEDEG